MHVETDTPLSARVAWSGCVVVDSMARGRRGRYINPVERINHAALMYVFMLPLL